MGIKGLMRVLADEAPGAIHERDFSAFCGRKVAIDASMTLYSFLISIRPDSEFTLTDANGEPTSHLQGMLNRVVRLLNAGIKPVFVFDGKPPTMKTGELAKRKKAKQEAREGLAKAKEEGDTEAIAKFSKRTVTVTTKHNEECKKLLRLLGVPVVQAPCEAEASCAELAKHGLVYATGTEDMDALTLGTPILLRYLTFSETRKMNVVEINLARALQELKITMDQFIDLGILLGCDYVPKIRGLGPKRALQSIREFGSLEKLIEKLPEKYTVPEGFNYEGARLLFKEPDVIDVKEVELKWKSPNEDELIQYLVTEKNFDEKRIRNVITKIKKSRRQSRLDSFFTVKRAPAAAAAAKTGSSEKRKAKNAMSQTGKKAKK